MKIGFCGAFQIDNTGDNILGLASRTAIGEFLPGTEPVLFPPRFPREDWNQAFDAERGLGIPIVPIEDPSSTDWARGLDGVVIGGGGIVEPSHAWRPFFLSDPASWETINVPAAWNGVGSQDACR